MRKGIAFVLTLVMLLTMIPMTAFAESFEDTAEHWAEDSIAKWCEEGVINGYGAYFNPNENSKRGESAQVFMKLFG